MDNGIVTIAISTTHLSKAMVDNDSTKKMIQRYPQLFELTSVSESKIKRYAMYGAGPPLFLHAFRIIQKRF
jgi:hypothetical protein